MIMRYISGLEEGIQEFMPYIGMIFRYSLLATSKLSASGFKSISRVHIGRHQEHTHRIFIIGRRCCCLSSTPSIAKIEVVVDGMITTAVHTNFMVQCPGSTRITCRRVVCWGIVVAFGVGCSWVAVKELKLNNHNG